MPVLVSAPGPIPPDQLAGRVTTAARPAQPVFPRTPQLVARAEERPPEPGRVWSGRPGPNRLTPKPALAQVRTEVPAPAPGSVVTSKAGFGVPRRPARPLIARAEERQPEPGRTFAGESPPPNLVPQQPPGTVRVAATEERQPEPGRLLTRVFGRKPSDRFAVRALVARVEEPQPAPGLVRSGRAWLELPRPPRALVARPEERPADVATVLRSARAATPAPAPLKAVRAAAEDAPPFAGWWLTRRFLAPAFTPPQQLAGRVLLAGAEATRPEEGRTTTLFGRPRAGAIPPVIT